MFSAREKGLIEKKGLSSQKEAPMGDFLEGEEEPLFKGVRSKPLVVPFSLYVRGRGKIAGLLPCKVCTECSLLV